jgi:hypothetical protein
MNQLRALDISSGFDVSSVFSSKSADSANGLKVSAKFSFKARHAQRAGNIRNPNVSTTSSLLDE